MEDLIDKFNEICDRNGSEMSGRLNDQSKLIALYALYHYFNGDETELDDVEDGIAHPQQFSACINGIYRSTTVDGNAADFLVSITTEELIKLENSNKLDDLIKGLAKDIGELVYRVQYANGSAQKVFDELGIQTVGADDASYSLKILCNWRPSTETKIAYQEQVASKTFDEGRLTCEILFTDDIEQEIEDVESPKEYIRAGTLALFGKPSKCIIGDEGSFITLISAKSLKQLFYAYSTRGLFASNLRFFISSKSIDPKIRETIIREPENFPYYNNGIIITCSDFEEKDGRLIFQNFSIVNGGQTTNLIGRANFDQDFGVVCKVIKNKYSDQDEKITFLSKVAEASNTQKPIKPKDLIANRKEQRLLKIQYADASMCLRIKRGEKLNKSLYPEPWQNATNDEVAQMIYSCVYQSPGAAKNSKASLLGNQKTYDLIFKDNHYDTNFLVSLQILREQYKNWKRFIGRTQPEHGSALVGLSRNANLLMYAVVGLLMKFQTNVALTEKIVSIVFSSSSSTLNDDEELKFLLKQNDIGKISLLKPSMIPTLRPDSLREFFNYLFDEMLVPAYSAFKTVYQDYAYSQFCKTDSYYYNYVVPRVIKICGRQSSELRGRMDIFFNVGQDSSEGFKTERNFDDYKPGLTEELLEFRTKTAEEEHVKPYAVIKQRQMPEITKYLPKTNDDLIGLCNFDEEQAYKYGQRIIAIVAKYCNPENFAKEVSQK